MALSRVRFAAFEFDPATGELWRDGRRVRLQRQPSRLLALLAARPGQLVTRGEIRAALWGDDTFVDFERSLNFCVGRLRSTLRDNAVSPQFIETVPTRGYRFIAPILAAPQADSVTPDPALAGQGPGRGIRWLMLAAIAAGAVAVAAVMYSVAARRPARDLPIVAVVPFDNETGSPDAARLAKGISDALVADLATPERLRRLRVIGNASELRFTFSPRNLKAMGDSLGARYIVLGQLKRDDQRYRIVAHLIRVSDQTHVWAATMDRDALDLPAQAEIATRVATAVDAISR